MFSWLTYIDVGDCLSSREMEEEGGQVEGRRWRRVEGGGG
jgi:hypothetical protein